MNAQVKKQDLLALAARYILKSQAAAVGVAFMVLNCECIKMCGVSAGGRLLRPLTLVLGAAAASRDRPPVCLSCKQDGGVSLQRLKRHGLIWAGSDAEKAEQDWRTQLGRRLFGDRTGGITLFI